MKIVLQEEIYNETLPKIRMMKIELPLIKLRLLEPSACMLTP